jgi:hypothetical protein
MQARKLSTLSAQPFQLWLHIRHPALDPREISRELQFVADECFSAGGPRESSSGVLAAASLHRESYWAAAMGVSFFGRFAGPPGQLLASARADQIPEIFIAMTCQRLSRNKAFVQRIRAEGGSVSLLVTLFGRAQSTLRLTPELCGQLSELGITIEFEFTGD